MYATTKVAKMNILNPTSASIIKRRLLSSSIPINGNVFLSRNFYNNNMRRLRATKLLPTSQKLVQNRQFTLKRQNKIQKKQYYHHNNVLKQFPQNVYVIKGGKEVMITTTTTTILIIIKI